MFSDAVATAIISTVGGIIIAFITVKYKDFKVKKKRTSTAPKDRMDNIFDGYERLILQLTTDMDRKESSIQRMESIIEELEAELAKTKELLASTKLELHQSQQQKNRLAEQLKEMRRDYKESSEIAEREQA